MVGAAEPLGLKLTRRGEGVRHGRLDPTLVESSLWTLSCGLELENRGLLDGNLQKALVCITPAWERPERSGARGARAFSWPQSGCSCGRVFRHIRQLQLTGGSGTWGTPQERHSSCPRGPRSSPEKSQSGGVWQRRFACASTAWKFSERHGLLCRDRSACGDLWRQEPGTGDYC